MKKNTKQTPNPKAAAKPKSTKPSDCGESPPIGSLDEEVFKAMADWAESKAGIRHILSLPGNEWLWERSFSNRFSALKLHFHGVEQNKRVWTGMSKTAQKLDQINKKHRFSATPEPMDTAAFLSSTDQRFDMIYLNWMAPLSQRELVQLDRIFFRKLLKRGGLLGITTTLSDKRPDIICGFQDMSGGGSRKPRWMPAGTARILVELGEENCQPLEMISHFSFVPGGKSSCKYSLAESIVFRMK